MTHLHNFGTKPDVQIDDHVRPYEAAARNYCQRIGVDPEGVTEIPHPFGLQGLPPVFRPAWCFAADKLIDLSHMLGALRDASGSTKVQ